MPYHTAARMERPRMSPTHFVLLVFFGMILESGQESVEVRGDNASMHKCFYNIQMRYGKHFSVLGEFHFMTDGPFPYSRELADAIYNVLLAATSFNRLENGTLLMTRSRTTEAWFKTELDVHFSIDDVPSRVAFFQIIGDAYKALKL